MTTTLCLERQLVFVHVAKTGGISMSHALRQDIPLHPLNSKPIRSLFQAVRDTGTIDLFRYTGTVILPEHATLSHVESVIDRDISDFFVFGTVRNPWERELSEYFYLTRQMKSRFLRRDYWRYRQKSFKNMLKIKLKDAESNLFRQQIDHFRRQNGNILLSDYCRFENLNLDYKRIANKINLSIKDLPHLNYSQTRNIDEFYDEEARDIVEKLYSNDIAYFDYRYPGG